MKFIADCLRRTLGQLQRLGATLARKNLSDNERDGWVLGFQRLSKTCRKMLRTTDDYAVVPFADLVAAWREFVETGRKVCRNQSAAINARLVKLGKPKMSLREVVVYAKSAVFDSLARVQKLDRDFERYKCEFAAIVSPKNGSPQ